MVSLLLKFIYASKFPNFYKAIFSWPIFSISSFLLVSRLKQSGITPSCILDLGANKGQFAIAAVNVFENALIYSFEPDPNIASILRNNVSTKNVMVHTLAIGDKTSTANFNVNADSQVSSLLALGEIRKTDFLSSTIIENIIVQTDTLDNFFINTELPSPILLKIDVQGYEDRVLKGAPNFLKNVQWVLVEVAFADLYEGEVDFFSISTLLHKNGFRLVRPLNWHLSPKTNQIIEMDMLFQKGPSAD